MLTAAQLQKYLEGQPDMSATIADAVRDLGVDAAQIHAAAKGSYWIMTDVYSDTNEPYVALEGE